MTITITGLMVQGKEPHSKQYKIFADKLSEMEELRNFDEINLAWRSIMEFLRTHSAYHEYELIGARIKKNRIEFEIEDTHACQLSGRCIMTHVYRYNKFFTAYDIIGVQQMNVPTGLILKLRDFIK